MYFAAFGEGLFKLIQLDGFGCNETFGLRRLLSRDAERRAAGWKQLPRGSGPAATFASSRSSSYAHVRWWASQVMLIQVGAESTTAVGGPSLGVFTLALLRLAYFNGDLLQHCGAIARRHYRSRCRGAGEIANEYLTLLDHLSSLPSTSAG